MFTPSIQSEVVESAQGVTYIPRLTEVSEILPRLEVDRIYSAYAICQLEPDRFPYTCWYRAEGDTGEALVMHSLGSMESNLWGYGAGVFCKGDPSALDVLLSLHPGPRFVQLKAQMEHLPVLKKHFRLRSEKPNVLKFRTTAVDVEAKGGIRPLNGDDIGAINRLYRSGKFLRLRGYRRQLVERGGWYGLFEDGRLVSLSGSQAFSPTYGVAFGGYRFTHPAYRNQGLATAVVNARDWNLFEKCSLHVAATDPANGPSMRVSEKLGAEFVGHVIDTPAFRRDLLGLKSLVRRIQARRQASVLSVSPSP
jgi:RimJ/RimL family protein N-acetyltransferase